MKSRPIIFDGESVRAILEGRKTQTRRVVKNKTALEWLAPDDLPGGSMFSPAFVANPENFLSPYGFAGDELWVRETFCSRFVDPPGPNGYYDGYWYAATDETPQKVDGDGCTVFRKNGEEASPWISPLRMPREASRLTLRVTDVRVERVRDISEADAMAEGCKPVVWSDPPWWQGYREFNGDLLHQQTQGEQPPDWMIEPHKMKPCKHMDTSARQMFAGRWISINEKRGFGWATNPWVWAVTFEVIR